jgi:hypothetical protein
MRKIEKVVVPAKTIIDQSHMVCDICSLIVKGRHDNWSTEEGGEEEIKIYHKVGQTFFGSSCGTSINFDICPECWNTKVLAFLLEKCLNNKPKYEHYEY